MNIFPHKKIHMAAWSSPYHVTDKQIDHICIKKKFSRSLQAARVQCSDHLLVAKLKLKKSGMAASSIWQKYNTQFLKNAKLQEEYGTTLSNKL